MSTAPQGNYVGQAWLVLLLGLVFGSALAGIHVALSPRIEQNKLDETLSQIPELVEGATEGVEVTLDTAPPRTVYKAMAGDRHVGWVVPARGQGFADVIELLVGLNAEATTITGVYVLKNNETPGLGNKITEAQWQVQFKGKPAGAQHPLVVVKRPPTAGTSEVEAVTGATISSNAVVAIVTRAVAEVRPQLQAASQD